jgi:hypothetical protein
VYRQARQTMIDELGIEPGELALLDMPAFTGWLSAPLLDQPLAAIGALSRCEGSG